MNQTLRVLIVDDSKEDARLLLEALRGGGYEISYALVDDPAAMRAALDQQDWDVICSDNAVPRFSVQSALALARELRPQVPFIIVAGEIDLDLAVSLMKDGAHDYVQKSALARLLPTIERALREVALRAENQQAKATLKISEARYRRLFETAQDGILILDADTGRIEDVNPFLRMLLGYSKEAILGKQLWDLGASQDQESSKAAFASLKQNGYVRYEDLPLETSNGQHVAVEFVSNVYLVDRKRVAQCNIRNITERKQAEADLREVNAGLEERVRERSALVETLCGELETSFNFTVSPDDGVASRSEAPEGFLLHPQ